MNVPTRYDEDTEAAQWVARHLLVYMKKKNWTQMRMAEELGISRASLGNILAGHRGIGTGLTLRIARRLLIAPDDLLLREPRQD